MPHAHAHVLKSIERAPQRPGEPTPLKTTTEDRIQHMLARLKRGALISDEDFDQIYPENIRSLSRVHWSPLDVVRRAVTLLSRGDHTRILDVGAGVGKFCLAGALLSPTTRFYGIEQREKFVFIARAIASRYHIPRAAFFHGNFQSMDWQVFHGIYLFNPFQENKTPDQRLDDTVELSRDTYYKYVDAVTKKLAEMPSGTRVVTYHGFGGEFPKGYVKRLSEWCVRGPLELWTKTS